MAFGILISSRCCTETAEEGGLGPIQADLRFHPDSAASSTNRVNQSPCTGQVWRVKRGVGGGNLGTAWLTGRARERSGVYPVTVDGIINTNIKNNVPLL